MEEPSSKNPGYLPLRELRSPNLLTGGIHVTDHKVLGDLLHVLIVKERVEAQLVCREEEREHE